MTKNILYIDVYIVCDRQKALWNTWRNISLLARFYNPYNIFTKHI